MIRRVINISYFSTLTDPNGNPTAAQSTTTSPIRRQSSSATSTYSDLDNRYASPHVTTIQIAPKLANSDLVSR